MQSVGWSWRVLVAVVFVVLGCIGRADAAPILSFGCKVDCTTVNQNDTFELVIGITDVPDYDSDPNVVVGLATFSFYLAFDPTIVRVNLPSDVSYGGFFGPLGSGVSFFHSCDPNPNPGQPCETPLFIGGAIDAPSLGITGSGDLAKITFEAIGFGPSGLQFLNGLCDPQDLSCVSTAPFFFNGVDDEPIALDIRNGSVFVDSTVPVPEPATLGLLGLGLLGVARRVRIQRRRERQTR